MERGAAEQLDFTILLLGLLLSTADNPLTSLVIVAMAALWALHIRVFPLTCLCACRPHDRTTVRGVARGIRSATAPSLETNAGHALLGTMHTTFVGGDTSDSSERGTRADSFGEEHEEVAWRA